MRDLIITGALLLCAPTAWGQTPQTQPRKFNSVEEALAAYDQTARGLDFELHDAKLKIADLTDQRKANELAAKTAADRRASLEEENQKARIQLAQTQAESRRSLAVALVEIIRQDAEIEKSLVICNLKGKCDLTVPPVTEKETGMAAAKDKDSEEILRMIRERIARRDLLTRALLADRLHAAGQDVLESATPAH